MIKSVAIGGMPATGKTSLMKEVRKQFEPFEEFSSGLVKGIVNKNNVYFIGVFDDSTFEGADRLSMAVQPEFIKWLSTIENATIVFEGDRLFSSSVIKKSNAQVIVIECNRETMGVRHKSRNDTQDSKWVHSRRSKIRNVIYEISHTKLQNNTKEDFEMNVAFIADAIRNPIPHQIDIFLPFNF
jgi:dephospho-CoA kinase